MSVHLSSQSAKPFNSSIDLETLNTDEGTERTTHPVLDKKKEIESGLKAAVSSHSILLSIGLYQLSF